MDHQSVVAMVGKRARMAMGGSFQQEVDLTSSFHAVKNAFEAPPRHVGNQRRVYTQDNPYGWLSNLSFGSAIS
jgi:hypothetical protein